MDNKEVKCEKCNKLMHCIFPYKGLKPEGQAVQKFNNVFDFDCTNQECENVGKIIKLNPFKNEK